METLGLNTESESPGSGGVVFETTGCALCGATDSRFVMTAGTLLYGRPGEARIVRCGKCGHYYQNPRPTRETIGLCYPQNYGPHVENEPTSGQESATDAAKRAPWYLSRAVRSIPGLRWLYYALADRYAELLPPVPHPGHALEIGCGRGRYLERLQQVGWQVEGIEPAWEPSQRCRERGLLVRTGLFEHFDYEGNSFDAVIAWMVIEHLHDPVSTLQSIRRLLRPEGVLLFSVPNFACWETWFFRGYHMILNEPTHLHHFTPQSIKQLLALTGFRLHRLHYQENLYNVVASLGLWFAKRYPQHSVGQRLLDFCESPSMSGRLALAPAAKLAAALRQTGRITVIAIPQPLSNHLESAGI